MPFNLQQGRPQMQGQVQGMPGGANGQLPLPPGQSPPPAPSRGGMTGQPVQGQQGGSQAPQQGYQGQGLTPWMKLRMQHGGSALGGPVQPQQSNYRPDWGGTRPQGPPMPQQAPPPSGNNGGIVPVGGGNVGGPTYLGPPVVMPWQAPPPSQYVPAPVGPDYGYLG